VGGRQDFFLFFLDWFLFLLREKSFVFCPKNNIINMSSYIQNLVKKQIKEWFPDEELIENYRPDWLIGLEIDLYLPRLNLAIEVNGIQHYLNTGKFFKNNSQFEMQVIRDFVKERIILNESINFIKIRQGANLLNGLQKQVNNALKTNFQISENIKAAYINHWEKYKSTFLNDSPNPSYVKITFLPKEKKVYKKLFADKKYSEALKYITCHAYFK
jgi:hypothetical protein